MLKKIPHFLFIFLFLCFVSFFSSASDGTINFTGSITTNACKVDNSSLSQSVSLGTVSSSSFSDVGSTSAGTRFNITLKDCSASSYKSASIKFEGPLNNLDRNLLSVNNGLDASNIAIGIYEQDGNTLIPLGSPSASKTLSNTSTNVFTYYAKYYAVETPVQPGPANATATFTIAYN